MYFPKMVLAEIQLVLFLQFFLQSAARPQEFFNTTPHPIKSNFTCVGRITGYYADVPSNCRVYHNCDDQGNKFSYYCPEMTAFRQEALICDHAHLVDCEAGTRIGKYKPEASRTNLNQSNSPTTRKADRWTTANPFRDFFSSRKNSTNSPFGFDFFNSSKSAPNFGKNQETQQNSMNEYRQSYFEQNKTKFFGNTIIESPAKLEDNFGQVKTNGDHPDSNSPVDHPAWYNNGENFRGRQEVNNERKLGDGQRFGHRAESRKSYFGFGQTMQTTTKSYFNFKNDDFSKPDARSTQISSMTSRKSFSTTPSTPGEISPRDFTASLKPLVPNTLEYDPYYPRESLTTTETYYTPSGRNKLPRALEAPNFEPSRFGVHFKIPNVWPDLNTLDDIIDRRKLFYIPRTEKLR